MIISMVAVRGCNHVYPPTVTYDFFTKKCRFNLRAAPPGAMRFLQPSSLLVRQEAAEAADMQNIEIRSALSRALFQKVAWILRAGRISIGSPSRPALSSVYHVTQKIYYFFPG